MAIALWAASEEDPLAVALRKIRTRVDVLKAAAETNPIIANDIHGLGSIHAVILTGEGLVEAQIAAVLTEHRGGWGLIRKVPDKEEPVESWIGGQNQENYVVLSVAHPRSLRK